MQKPPKILTMLMEQRWLALRGFFECGERMFEMTFERVNAVEHVI